jgi:hypothetical protein
LAAAGAGVAGVAAFPAGLAAFLFFFTGFLVVVVAVELLVAGVADVAGAWAAIDKPAVASESPNSIAEIFFMVFVFLFLFCEAACFLPLYSLTNALLTGPERAVKYDSP